MSDAVARLNAALEGRYAIVRRWPSSRSGGGVAFRLAAKADHMIRSRPQIIRQPLSPQLKDRSWLAPPYR